MNADTVPGGLKNLSITNAATETALATSNGGTNRAAVVGAGTLGSFTIPSTLVDGHHFIVRTEGLITGNTTTNHTMRLYWNSGNNPTSTSVFTGDKILFNSGNIAVSQNTINFYVFADLIWDSVSSNMNGSTWAQFGSSFVPQAAALNIPVAVPALSNLQFTVSSLFSVSNSGNQFVVREMSVDLL